MLFLEVLPPLQCPERSENQLLTLSKFWLLKLRKLTNDDRFLCLSMKRLLTFPKERRTKKTCGFIVVQTLALQWTGGLSKVYSVFAAWQLGEGGYERCLDGIESCKFQKFERRFSNHQFGLNTGWRLILENRFGISYFSLFSIKW